MAQMYELQQLDTGSGRATFLQEAGLTNMYICPACGRRAPALCLVGNRALCELCVEQDPEVSGHGS